MKLIIIFHVLLVLFLTGCHDNEEPIVQKRGAIKERSSQIEKRVNWVGHWQDEHDRETLVREVAQDFELMNPEIDLNLRFIREIKGQVGPKVAGQFIADMIESGNITWDIVWLNQFIYQHVAEQLDDPNWRAKYLVNFEGVEGFAQTQKSFIMDDPVYRDQTGGIIVGPYIEGYYMSIFYNKNVAKKIGLPIKQYGMTFEDLLGYLKAIEEYNTTHDTQLAAFYESINWPTMMVLFQNLFKSALKNFDNAKTEEKGDEKDRALLKTLQAFEQLGKYNPLIHSHKSNIFHDTKHLVLQDVCLFFINGSWMYSHWMGIDEEKTKKMIPAELPVFQEVNYYSGSFIPTWAVMKDSPQRDEAIKLLMFWSRSRVAEKWVRYAKAPTGLTGNISSFDIGNDPFAQFLTRVTGKYGGNIHYSANTGFLLGKENRLLQPLLDKKLIQLLNSDITAQQAYEDIMKEVK